MSQQVAIPWVTRADLVAVHSLARFGTSTHVVKDQVKSEFFHFDELDYFILEQLRQPLTAAQLIERIESQVQ